MPEGALKSRLSQGEVVYGCFTRYPSSMLTEYLATLGWDFLVLDAEHGSIDSGDVSDHCRACQLHRVASLTRVRLGNDPMIGRVLDAGAAGVHLPGIESTADLHEAIRRLRYPPLGNRGLAGTRSSRFATGRELGDHAVRAHEDLTTVVQVETAGAVDAIEDWVRIDGVDILFVGLTDLSVSLGHPGEPTHPDVVGAVARVVESVTSSDRHLGVFVADKDSADQWVERGARYIATGLEGLLLRSSEAFLG